MSRKKPNKPYYYASGKRVTLEPDADLVAVDDARLAERLPDLLKADAALRSGRPLTRGIRLVRRNDLKADTLDRLESAGVTQPVFRQADATLVVLPEIRIEDDSEAKLAEARQFAVGKAQQVGGHTEGKLTLQPLSDDGRDALTLANELVERYQLSSVSPHFLRVVSGPSRG